jgi:glutaminyl-tRNA synthetase
MASGNLNLRDPVMYRILHATHHRTGDKWCIYPMYDFTHGQSDSIERITHSICTLEFEDHRPLYDWFLDELGIYHPQQIEFARLNLTHTITSKRKLGRLVSEGYVSGWDDPRMPTLSGMRRRGYSPAAIRKFCDIVGVAKSNSMVEMAVLEHVIRDELNQNAPRAMAVLRPLRVVIENYPEGQVEQFEVPNYPQDRNNTETRKVPFSRVIYIEREDFMEDPPKKFFRLAPGREVRLLGAYYITCVDVLKDEATGEIVELRCKYDPQSRGGSSPDGRKVRGTLHWVSAEHARQAQVRLYDILFEKENPGVVEDGLDFIDYLNPYSLEELRDAWVEPSLAHAKPGVSFQFMRQGYFAVDIKDTSGDNLVFNRTVTLRDTWAKIQKAK